MTEYLHTLWKLSAMVAPSLLMGVFLAAIVKRLLGEQWVRSRLGREGFGSVLRAVFYGIPLPLCSCSVLPFASTLRQAGAGRPATLSFLIATPITGLDSMAATYGVFGGFFTLYRVISSVMIALFAGMFGMWVDRKVSVAGMRFSSAPPSSESCSSGSCCSTGRGRSFWSFSEIWRDAVEVILADFAGALAAGMVLGAALMLWVPPSFFHWLGENLWLNYLIVLGISALLYICATSSVPLGAALWSAGLSPGAVFVLLSAGPAMSLVSLSVVGSMLGRRFLAVYLGTVLSGTLLFAWGLDRFFISYLPTLTSESFSGEDLAGWEFAVAGILWGLLLWVAWKKLRRPRSCCA